jgi:transcriptional regulator with XRE-family HTH domain
MATLERARDRGARQSRALAQSVASELLEARLAAGVSQTHVARAAGLAQSRISRTERAAVPQARLDELTRHCAVLGLKLTMRVYPEGVPVRDAGQLRLLRRLREVVSERFRWRSEVLIGGHGDLRAWDVVLDGPGVVAIDAESCIRDVQALQRRLELKWRDSGMPRLVLVVAATHHNRAVLREHRAALASTLPLDPRRTLAALRAGEVPPENGIVLLRPSDRAGAD